MNFFVPFCKFVGKNEVFDEKSHYSHAVFS